MMHGHKSIKFANAKQAQEISKFKTLKRRLHKTTATLCCNKTCRTKQLTPTYISIRTNGKSRRDKNTIQAATHFRLIQEIKFLNTKKVKLNEQLYKQHLECAALWPSYWQTIMDIINDNLQWEMDNHYKKLNGKLERFQEKHNNSMRKPKGQQPTSYLRTINLTDIQFADEEQKLLDLGLQYSMQKPTKTTWENLFIETERAIKLLDDKLQNLFSIIAAKKLK